MAGVIPKKLPFVIAMVLPLATNDTKVFAVDESVMEANASDYHGKVPDELDWTGKQRQKRAVVEYLSVLDAVESAILHRTWTMMNILETKGTAGGSRQHTVLSISRVALSHAEQHSTKNCGSSYRHCIR